jgi:phosphonate transport system substrate-binding protein
MARIVLYLVLLLGACACTPTGAALPYVDLSQRSPLPAAAEMEVAPLRVAVAAILSPQGTVESYQEMVDYLGSRLGRPVELIQRRTYREVNSLIEQGVVDLAFVCTRAYVEGHEAFGMQLLVAPQINGDTVYHSVLIVPASSDARTLEDLRGRVFAFTDPISHTGRTYPTFLVQQLGEVPEQFFRRTFYTYSHDRAIEAVAAGVADGAGVDSLVLEHALARDPTLAGQLRVIHRSEPFAVPPVVVPPGMPPRQQAALRDLLLGLHEDPAARPILARLNLERFVVLDDSAYTSVREILWQVERTR